MGLPIFVGLRTTEIPDLQPPLAAYRDAWRAAGHAGDPSVYLRIPVYVAPTEQGAIEEPNLDPMLSMVDLVSIQRSYAANIDALKAMDSVLGVITGEVGKTS